MLRRIRSIVASLAVAGLLVAMAAPASASGRSLDEIDPNNVPVLVDIALLRPAGLVMTAVGAAVFIPVGGFTWLIRRDDGHKPFDYLVREPFTYTFKQPSLKTCSSTTWRRRRRAGSAPSSSAGASTRRPIGTTRRRGGVRRPSRSRSASCASRATSGSTTG